MNCHDQETRALIVSLVADQARLKAQQEELTKKLRETCQHSIVLEGPYIPSDYGNSIPPHRVCLLCGVDEEGWGCGYKTLRDAPGREVREVKRDVIWKHRVPQPLETTVRPKETPKP